MNEVNKNSGDNQQGDNKYNQPVKQNNGNRPFKKDFNRKPFQNNQIQNNQQRASNADDLSIPQNQKKDSYPPRRDPRRDFTRHDNIKIKVEETKEDIERDILRIEKEIDLEIKEITTMRLGL